MSTVITLIKVQEVVNTGILKATPLSSRFDASLLSPWLDIAEKRFLKTFICTDFYNEMIANMNPLPSNYNIDLGPIELKFPTDANLENLWTQFLLPYLSLSVYYVALPNISLQTGSNGLFFNNTDFSQNAGLDGLKFMQNTQLQNLNDLKPSIINYLCDNAALFPLFCRSGVCIECGCVGCSSGEECTGQVPQGGRDLGIQFY